MSCPTLSDHMGMPSGRFPPLGLSFRGIRLRRDSGVSVMYAEELHSTTSSVTLQRTDRHEILGQKPADFQGSLSPRQATCAPACPQDRMVQKECASSHAGH